MGDWYGKGWSYADVVQHMEDKAIYEREKREADPEVHIFEGEARERSFSPQKTTTSTHRRRKKGPNRGPNCLGIFLIIIVIFLIVVACLFALP